MTRSEKIRELVFFLGLLAYAALLVFLFNYAMRQGIRDGLVNLARPAQPTMLILTVVEEKRPPSVCIFEVATETLIGDTIRVVVNRAPCPALQP